MITRQFLFVVAAFGLWTCVACRPKFSFINETNADEVAQEEPADSLANDSLDEYGTDELVEEMESTPNRKEAFSEFFFAFLASRPFQASRVKFPLSVANEDEEYVIRSGKDFRAFFAWPSASEYCVLVNREEQMENFLNDMDISDVDVQVIDLSTERIRQIHFNREENEWFAMNATEYEPEGTLADFLHFYDLFVTDSLYQHSHLAEQIEFTQSDLEEEGENINGTIEAYQWNIFRPELPNGHITNFLFGQNLEDSNEMVLMHSSIADDIVEPFTFRKRNGHWLLTGYNN